MCFCIMRCCISFINLQYKDALYNAGKALEDLMEICQSAQFETHEGWEKRASRSHCIVYSKAFNVGTVFTLRVSALCLLIYGDFRLILIAIVIDTINTHFMNIDIQKIIKAYY